jgi:hypothetical protein
MEMRTTMVLFDDGGFAYMSSCARCTYVSPMLDDEDDTYVAWRGHRCGHVRR